MDGIRNIKISTLKSDESGQSTIEFLSSFVFVIGLIILFVKVSISATNGYIVHYATFMASRTYAVYDNNINSPDGADGTAYDSAKAVFDSFQLDAVMPGFAGELKVNHPGFGGRSVFVGTYVEFQQPFSMGGMFGGGAEMDLVSESFLGREPTRATCVERICNAMTAAGGNCQKYTTVCDNGC